MVSEEKKVGKVGVGQGVGGGRPTKSKSVDYDLITRLYEQGCSDLQVAGIIGVATASIHNWKKSDKKFLDALKKAKISPDDRVQRALFERAIGASHPDVHISNFKGEITVTPYIKSYAPDTVACIFWLKNRRRAEWRDKVEVDHSMDDAIDVDALKKEVKALMKANNIDLLEDKK